jgi:hypothetical protein
VSVPRSLSDGLAVIMLAIAAYCAIRPAAARRWHRTTERDSDAAHVLMGVAMAAVLMPGLNPVGTGAWTVALAAACVWFAARAVLDRRARLSRADRAGPAIGADSAGRTPNRPGTGSGHHLVHLLSCGSMLYMLLGASSVAASAATVTSLPPGDAAGTSLTTGAAISPLIAFALALAMAGSVVVTTDRLAMVAPARSAQLPGTGGPVLCPRLATACQIVMGITMVYMLVLML